jgi:uncharacterized protein DUF2550
VRIVEGIGVGVLIVLFGLALLYLRRIYLAGRGGTIELGVRLSTMVPGRGWAAGVARFTGDDLRWYRIFSFWPGPRRVFSRRGLAVERRRLPDVAERMVLPADWIIVRCVSRHAPVEIAMAEPALTGFLSWVEAAPPGESTPETRPHRYRSN